MEAALRDWWSGPQGATSRALHAAALPAELAFQGAVALRGRAYEAGLLSVHRAAVPVVCVGNLTVGGTGKTPLAAWVVSVLLGAGRTPAVVLRGYGRDEVLLHRAWHPEARVYADPDRVAAARTAAAAGADVIVADDGFQHRRLARDLDLVAVAAEQPFPGPLLPRGPYREPVAALRRADWVVVTRRTADAAAADRVSNAIRRLAPGVRLARARLAPAGWSTLAGAPAQPPSGEVLAVAAVADPTAFATSVGRATGARVDLRAWPDHHEYGAEDVERIVREAGRRAVVTTEKDAVKLRAFAARLPGARVLGLRVDIEAGEAPLRAALLEAAARGPTPATNGEGGR